MKKPTIESIYNYVRLSDHWGTAGQPTDEEFVLIKEAGYAIVVNLLPDLKVLPSEPEIVQRLGMEYTRIPVVWDAPTRADFERFAAVMDANAEQHVFVHCAANMRVSAFCYLYRTLRLGVAEEVAVADLHRIWVPNDTWQQFIAETRLSVVSETRSVWNHSDSWPDRLV
jgi:protein tyrosine phosphatase (PTP) superfamily phosphohydrolase (DUF442 family)